MEFWLKRYLDIFFNFNEFGNLNWLAIPLFIYFVATIKKRKRWEMAIASVFILSCLSLGIRGYGYPRYIFTLYPFTLGAIFLFAWELIKKKSHNLQIGMFVICTIVVFFNLYHYRESYKQLWRSRVTRVDYSFPRELLKFINNIEDLSSDSSILVRSHRHLFFYHTDKKGIDSRDPKLEFFNRQPNKKAALDVLINQLKVKYILVHWRYKPSWILSEIITNDCDLVYAELGMYLYRLHDKDLDKEELEKLFINDSLLRNGSFEDWSRGPLKKPNFFDKGYNILEGMVIREEKEVKVGRYSAKITGDNFSFAQDLTDYEEYRGKNLICVTWVKTNVPDKYRIQISDDIHSSFSRRHSGRGGWELLEVSHTVDPLAKFVTIKIIQAAKTGKVDDVIYVDGALLVESDKNTFYLYVLNMNKKE